MAYGGPWQTITFP
ncbi:hypothetical protein VTL71DRAFT_3850 [Oculimacula yallundae]|uniref:Uncharacterized protein n=1 Tax=Oculimacula yallundae TaxID=86028 RepID=A0ABR4C5D5_9HELO